MFPMSTLMHGGLERAADRLGDRDAVWAGDEVWTFGDLDGLANAFARHLAAQGVGPGGRVAVMTSNRVEFVAVVHAVSKLGAAAVLLSPAWKEIEVDHALGLTSPGPRRRRRTGRRRCWPTGWAPAASPTSTTRRRWPRRSPTAAPGRPAPAEPPPAPTT